MFGIGAGAIAAFLVMGTVAGYLAGLLGIGGGMLMVPFMAIVLTSQGVDTGVAFKMAIATSGATILFTSVSSLLSHHRHGAVRWPLVLRFAPGIVAGGLVAGGGVMAVLKGQWMALAFALFLVFMAWRMWRGVTPRPERRLPGTPGLLAMGGVIGFVSALVGAGGAFLSVPFMTRRNVPMREAVGTSAAIGFPIAVGATSGYVIAGWTLPPVVPGTLGYLYLPGVLIVAAASVLLAPLGARAAHRMPVTRLRKVFACMLMLLAVHVAWKALTG